MDIPARYLRNLGPLSGSEQNSLAGRRIVVAGCGGLGGYVLEHLARLGVGHLTAIDCDVFDETNLNRQRFADRNSLGLSKVRTVKEQLSAINPDLTVAARQLVLTDKNAVELLAGCDLVIDALDNVPSRLILSRAASELGLPLVHGAVSGWQGHAAVVSPGSGLPERLYAGRSAGPKSGTLSFTCALIAAIQAALAAAVLLGRSIPHRDKLLAVDLLAGTFDVLDI